MTWAARGDAHLGGGKKIEGRGRQQKRPLVRLPQREEGGRKAMASERDKGAEVSVEIVCCAEKVGQMNESFIKWLILI